MKARENLTSTTVDQTTSSRIYISFQNESKRNELGPAIDPIKSPFSSMGAFRQAVAYAIDRPRVINNILQEDWVTAKTHRFKEGSLTTFHLKRG